MCINRSDFETFELTPILWDEKLILQENKFGIPEPINGKALKLQDIDIVLVPLLAFTIEGHRLGYGKGFYDRYLNKFDNIITVGVAFSFQKHHKLPRDKNDVKLNYI